MARIDQQGEGGERAAAAKDLFPERRKSRTAVETVISTIKGLLVERKLRPGDLLPSENEIASSLSISRGSIREAMKILSAFGVVEIRQGDGTRVATSANRKLFDPLMFNLLVTEPEVEELAELRTLVEDGIIRLAMAHATEKDLDDLEGAYGDMDAAMKRQPPDAKALFAADLRFHTLLGTITHNRLVANVYQFVIELLTPTMHPGFGLETHARIVRALKARDLDASLRAMAEHEDVWHRLAVPPEARP